MTKREFLDIVFALAPNEANAIMDAFDEYVDSNEPHWIPVTERLPETHELVLVWSNGYICQDSIVCPWDDKIWYRCGKIEDGDYWMPLSELPEPYKGVTDGTD